MNDRADLFGGFDERRAVAEQRPVVARQGHASVGVPELSMTSARAG
jgi:hypothetical protein